jgi:hypothetical protein
MLQELEKKIEPVRQMLTDRERMRSFKDERAKELML